MQLSTGDFNKGYVVNGYRITRIYFYSEGEVVFTLDRGWLESRGSNRYAETYINSCETIEHVANKRKIDLSKRQHFTAKYRNETWREYQMALYICLDAFPLWNVEEELDLETSTEKHYRQFLYLTGSFDGEEKIVKLPASQYSRIVKTSKGEGVDRLKRVLNTLLGKDKIGLYDAEKLYDNWAEIEKVMGE